MCVKYESELYFYFEFRNANLQPCGSLDIELLTGTVVPYYVYNSCTFYKFAYMFLLNRIRISAHFREACVLSWFPLTHGCESERVGGRALKKYKWTNEPLTREAFVQLSYFDANPKEPAQHYALIPLKRT